MRRSCCANNCHPTGFLLCLNRLFTRSVTLLPGTGTPSCIYSPRSDHATSFLRRSINCLVLYCMVLRTVATRSSTSFGASSDAVALVGIGSSSFDHASRCFDASIRQIVVPLQDLIVQRDLVPSLRSFRSTMKVISAASPCMTLPTMSVGGGGDRRVSSNLGSTKAI